jgi:hypothetical protein
VNSRLDEENVMEMAKKNTIIKYHFVHKSNQNHQESLIILYFLDNIFQPYQQILLCLMALWINTNREYIIKEKSCFLLAQFFLKNACMIKQQNKL